MIDAKDIVFSVLLADSWVFFGLLLEWKSCFCRTFLECKEVKAVINVGCCYNLLTEECSSTTGETTKDSMSGFPLSKGVHHLDLHLGKNGRDLACQSAERWRDDLPESALRNFESHAFRAALQLVCFSLPCFPSLIESRTTRRCLKSRLCFVVQYGGEG
jgi:hypothetical protein